MPDHSPQSSLLADLFPPQARTCLSAELPADSALLPEELAFTPGMVPKRMREFAHGRYCARSALQELGLSRVAIGKGANRQPLWPAGIAGSISHCEDMAAAVAGWTKDFAGLGLDIETDAPLGVDLLPLVCLPEENPENDGERGKLLFSAKEAVYKCIYPLVNEFVDFLEMQLTFESDAQRFTACPRAARLDSAIISRLQGRYIYTEGFVVSAAWIT